MKDTHGYGGTNLSMEAFASDKECCYHKKLLKFTLGIGMDVLHHYFEQKILNSVDFFLFLEKYKHCLFHECYPKRQCCECSKDNLVSSKKGSLSESQFKLLFDIATVTKMDHYQIGIHNEIIKDCLCRFDAKRSNDVDCMDITLMCAIINSCLKKSIHGHPDNFKTIKKTRNILSHAPGQRILESEFTKLWTETEQAILEIAKTLGNYFVKDTKRKIDAFKKDNLSMEKFVEIMESNADIVKKNFLETQKINTALVTDATDVISQLLKKYEDKMSVEIGNIRFEVKQFTKEKSVSSLEKIVDTKDQVPHMDTEACASDVQITEKDKNQVLNMDTEACVSDVQMTEKDKNQVPHMDTEACASDVQITEKNKRVMSAQLRLSARKRKHLPIVAAASARKKANQRVPDTMSVPAPQLPTVDTGIPFIPVTSSIGTYPMLFSQTGAGIYTSASTGPVDLTSTASTLLYSRVPDQRECNTVTSQDPPEHYLDVKKCRVEWRLETPDTWNLTEIKETLVKFSEMLRPWFEIEFVHIGSLVIKTLVQKKVLDNRDQMRASVQSFLEKLVEVCKINTDVPSVIKVDLIIQLDETDNEETNNEGQVGRSTETELNTTVKGGIPDTSNEENRLDTNGRKSQKEESFEPKKDFHTTCEKGKILFSKKSFLEEEDNYLNFCRLVFNIGTPALDTTFAENFSKIKLEGLDKNATYTLQEIFNNYHKLLDDLNSKQQITDSNRDLLRSPELHTTFEKWKILFSKKSFLEEEDNYLRVCLLVFNIGTRALHKTFAENFSKIKLEGMDRNATYTLQEIFNDYNKLLDDLNSKQRITDSNRDLLRSPDRVNNSELYDIKLMAVLLTAFESEEIITLKETTKKAILDIHTQRNEIAHKLTPKLSSKELNTIWNTISKAIKELGGTSYEQECNTLMNSTLDSSNTTINQSIKDILSSISDLQSECCQEIEDSQTEGNNEDSIFTTAKENFVRLCALLVLIAPLAVRFCITRLFPEILGEKHKRLQGVNTDIDLEYSIGRSGIKDEDNVDSCPLPLMLFLLKDWWEFRILDELPDPSETSIDADLTRINYYTQLIGDYKTTGSITTTDFNEIWNNVAEAISRLGDVRMKMSCECLKMANIDETHADIIIGLVDVQKKIITLKKHKDKLTETLAEFRDPLYMIIQAKMQEVEEWVVEDKMFVETRASAELLKCSRDKHVKSITVVGSFGVGKTFTTRHVSLILRHEEYRILPVSTVDEIREIDDEQIPTLFIVDDFCGKISLSVEQRMRDIKKWRKMSEVLLGGKSKIIVCCTLMFYQHYSSKSLSFFRSCVIDMNSSNLALNNNELLSIAKMNADMDENLIKKYSKEFSFFPFLCKQCQLLSVMKSDIPQVVCHEAILKNAKVVYTSQMDFFHREDRAKFTALAMIVQLNNYVKECYLRETSNDFISVLDKINMTLDACEFDHSNALSDIEEELISMIGSYITVSTDSKNSLVYSAKNEHLFGVLVAYFKNELPECCSGSFRSKKNYSKLRSFLTGVYRKANRRISLFLPWLMFAICISVLSMLLSYC